MEAKILAEERVSPSDRVERESPRYFIGFLVEGEAAEYQQKLLREIQAKFRIEGRAPKIPPHITAVSPFRTEDVEAVRGIMGKWLGDYPKDHQAVLGGFGYYEDKVVYLKVALPLELTRAVLGLRALLDSITGKGTIPWNPHFTIATRLLPEELEAVKKSLETVPEPRFAVSFEKLTLFHLDEEKSEWKIASW